MKLAFYIFLTVLLTCSFASGHLSEEKFGAENGQIQADTVAVCRSYIPFAVDVSTKLTPAQFKALKSFLFRPFLSSLFPVDIQPAPFSTYSEQNHGYRRPNNVSDISNFILNVAQGTSTYSFINGPLKYFVDQNVTSFATAKLAVNTVIFAGNSISASDVQLVQYYISILTEYANTVTIVLMNPDIDQTYYQQIPGLNLVVWSDFTTTISAIRSGMRCGFVPSTTTTARPTTTTTTPITTTTSTTTAAVTVSPGACKSYIPFSFDISQFLNSTQFASLKAFLLDPFLSELFSLNVQPAPFSMYDSVNHGYNRLANVSNVISTVRSSVQHSIPVSDILLPLGYFVNQGVVNLGSSDGLAVNSIIFAGASLSNVNTASFYSSSLTTGRNTLTVVLVNPNIDQTNYRQVPGLKIVVWSDPATTLAAIKRGMNCGRQKTNIFH